MELDANVGKVMDAIRGAGINKNTIVVFSSDKGPLVDAWPDAGHGPFRGMKGTGFENGWRVPGLMWAPGRIPSGSVLRGLMSHMDVWPTTAAMAGLTPPPHGEYKDNNSNPVCRAGVPLVRMRAAEMGAYAVIGVRYDATEGMQSHGRALLWHSS